MYLRESDRLEEKSFNPGMTQQIVTAGLMILTIYFGLFFQPLVDFARYSAAMFGTSLF